MLDKIVKGKKNITLTVGIENEGKRYITVYDANLNKRESQSELYEIGSLTKTFTASLISKMIYENKLSLNSRINDVISNLNRDFTYPTVSELLTHTSGYSQKMPFSTSNFLNSTNDQIKNSLLNNEAKRNHSYTYANINYSILAMMYEEISNSTYVDSMMDMISNEFNLSNTTFDFTNVLLGYGTNDKSGNWIWDQSENVIASGGLYSNVDDLLDYLTIQTDKTIDYIKQSHRVIGSGTKSYNMAYGWKYNKKGNILWHNGGTGCFSTFIGFNLDTGKKVVILSNYRSLYIDKYGSELLYENKVCKKSQIKLIWDFFSRAIE